MLGHFLRLAVVANWKQFSTNKETKQTKVGSMRDDCGWKGKGGPVQVAGQLKRLTATPPTRTDSHIVHAAAGGQAENTCEEENVSE